jgi:phytoene synthase
MILAGGQPTEAADAAGHLGVGQALTGHLRAFGYNASRGRIFLPWSVFAANGLREADVLAGRSSAGLELARRQLCDIAAEHLDKAAAAIRALPRALRPAFLALALVRPQLRRVAAQSEPLVLPADLGDLGKLLRLAHARWLQP